MIKASREVVGFVIEQKASNHRKTGAMVKSVKIFKPKYKEKSSSYVGFVGF
ncbi:MAG: hypothetical protein LBI55_02560 [Oscillospiraceae bacterium]|jgi:hypothetical protein|nr:hypothetical protein [Oscillospiraceae bacterium]